MLVRAAARIGVVTYEMLPCPCGRLTNPRLSCKCTAKQIERHLLKHATMVCLCDICVEVSLVPANELLSKRLGTGLASIQEQLTQANEDATFLIDAPECREVLHQVTTQLGLTARQVDVAKRVAISIARLAQTEIVSVAHLLEALHYVRFVVLYLRGV